MVTFRDLVRDDGGSDDGGGKDYQLKRGTKSAWFYSRSVKFRASKKN